MNLHRRASIPAKPRAVEKTHPFFIGRMLALLVLWVFATLAIVSVGYLLLDGAYRWVGERTTARITVLREVREQFSGGLLHLAAYEIQKPDGSVHADESAINWAQYKQFSEPYRRSMTFMASDAEGLNTIRIPPSDSPQIAVEVLRFGPLLLSRAEEQAWTPTLRVVAWIIAPVMLFTTWVLYLAVIARPRRVRRFYTHGEVADGVIRSKEVARSDESVAYLGHYVFTPSPATTQHHGQIIFATEAEYDSVSAGDAITVLYDPVNPSHNLAYDFGGYRWVR